MTGQKSSRQAGKAYKTDVTDEQWELIRDLIPAAVAKKGREATDLREILNTILYQNKTGCPWDMLPHDLCARSTTFDYYKAWQDNGVWERILDTLRAKARVAPPRVKPQAQASPTVEAKAAVEAEPHST